MTIKKREISLLLNILIVLFEIFAITLYKPLNCNFFVYYTNLSNIFLFITSVIFIYYALKNKEINKKVQILKYSSTVSVTLTFLVVVLVLSWQIKGGLFLLLFEEPFLYVHTLCPILAIITFIFFEYYDLKENINIFYAVIFTIIYAIITVILNILRIIRGPYPFLMVYQQPVRVSILWFIILLLITMLIAFILRKLNRKWG